MLSNHLLQKLHSSCRVTHHFFLFLQKISSENCNTTLLLPLREYLKLLTLHFLNNYSIFDNFDQNLLKLLTFGQNIKISQNTKIIILLFSHPSAWDILSNFTPAHTPSYWQIIF